MFFLLFVKDRLGIKYLRKIILDWFLVKKKMMRWMYIWKKKKIFDIVDINVFKKIRVKLKEYLFIIVCIYK